MPSSAGLRPSSTTRIHSDSLVIHGFQQLDVDVLLQVFEELRPQSGLQPLSLTCKWVRESVKPVLFRSCRQAASAMTWEEFVPRQLWPYIRELFIYGGWWPFDPPPIVRCHVPFNLDRALSDLPRLTTISVKSLGGWVPWESMVAMISLPRLRTFEVDGLLYIDDFTNLPVFTAAPLTRYQQVAGDFRPQRYNVANSLFLSMILDQPQVQDSLESLEAPSEFVAIDMFADSQWPRLRCISLRGENWEHDRPVVHYFSHTPALRELVLMLGHRSGSELLRLCPPGWAGPLPWPELEALTLTHPDPDDPLYSFLPETLHHLTLRCWPRHYNFEFYESSCVADRYGWGAPVLSSSALFNILHRCHTSHLETLEVEFVGDEADIAVFQLISRAFPYLSSLTILRYRPRHTATIPIREIGEALRPLSRLSHLYLYLDFVEAPHPLFGGRRPSDLVMEDCFRITGIFAQSADIIARALGPSLEIIAFLLRGPSINEWFPFLVEHVGDGRHVHLDRGALLDRGLISNDD
ncbi:hypothetical protein FKP32DRAFT_1673194 [Trametes sanguinea]|nr:hypothetical protein FKP32DRAFT_1673194 [Trametes sanguinea]